MTDKLALGAAAAPLQRSNAEKNEFLIRRYVDWLGVRNYSRCTLKAYGHHLRDFAAFLGARSILEIEHSDVLGYLSGLHSSGLSKGSMFAYIQALRSFQRFIDLVQLPSSGALGKLKPPKIASKIGAFHPLEEVERLIAAAKTPLERAFIELAFATACRISELRGIRAEQVDWKNRRITVLGKGNKERVVFFGKCADTAMREYLNGRTEGVLFPYSERQLQRVVSVVGARVGLRTHPHKLRHSCVSAMLNNGAGIRELQELLGHSSVSTTARYLHSTTADLLKVHAQFHPHGGQQKEDKDGQDR